MTVVTSTTLELLREIADACDSHIHGFSSAAATTSLTAASPPFKSARTNESSKKYEGDELYLSLAQPSTTIVTTDLTASSSSILVTSGASWPTGATVVFPVGIEQELILVTRSTNTLTVISGGRGWRGTRAAAHLIGTTVYGPATSYNPEQIAAYVASTGVFTPGNTWSIDPGEVVPFEVFMRGVSYWDVLMALNKALGELTYEDYFPLGLIADGDMRANLYSHWTAGGSPTISKVANANAIEGPQSLRVLASVANDYAESDTIVVDPGYAASWYFRALVRADVGTCTLRGYDKTNSATIDSLTWSERGWGFLDLPIALPTTANAISARLISVSSTSDAYWAYVQAVRLGATIIDLPDWANRPDLIRRVVTDRRFGGAHRYDTPDWVEVPGHIVPNPANPNNAFQYALDHPVTGPLYLHASRPYDFVTADAQTLFVDRDLVVAAGAYKLAQEKIRSSATAIRADWEATYAACLKEYRRVCRQRVAGPTLNLGWGGAW